MLEVIPTVEAFDLLDTNLHKQSYAEFNLTLHAFADALENHSFFGANWEPYVPGPPHFRGHAARLKELGVGADRGDRALKAERDRVRALAQLHIDLAVNYMVIRAVEQNDPTLLHNTPLPMKNKAVKGANKSISSDSEPVVLTAKHVKGKSGAIVIHGKHGRKGRGPYLLHICKGEPVSEESWYSPGGHYNTCGTIVLTGLEPANRYYFRIKTDGPEGQGPWSQVISIIVL